jgi:hypothetical protein
MKTRLPYIFIYIQSHSGCRQWNSTPHTQSYLRRVPPDVDRSAVPARTLSTGALAPATQDAEVRTTVGERAVPLHTWVLALASTRCTDTRKGTEVRVGCTAPPMMRGAGAATAGCVDGGRNGACQWGSGHGLKGERVVHRPPINPHRNRHSERPWVTPTPAAATPDSPLQARLQSHQVRMYDAHAVAWATTRPRKRQQAQAVGGPAPRGPPLHCWWRFVRSHPRPQLPAAPTRAQRTCLQGCRACCTAQRKCQGKRCCCGGHGCAHRGALRT